MTFRATAILALLATTTALGCEPDVKTASWDRMEYSAFLDQLAAPTGYLVNGSYEETHAALEESLGVTLGENGQLSKDIEILYHQLETTISVLESSVGGEPEPVQDTGEKEAKGTTIFARISCVGPNAKEPVTDYSAGTIVLESPSFKLLDALGDDFFLEGHTYAKFEDCEDEDVTIRGDAPGYLSDFHDHIALDLNITFEEDLIGEHTMNEMVLISYNSVDLSVDTGTNGIYTLGLTPGLDTEYVLGTAEGFFQCEMGISGLSCDEIDYQPLRILRVLKLGFQCSDFSEIQGRSHVQYAVMENHVCAREGVDRVLPGIHMDCGNFSELNRIDSGQRGRPHHISVPGL